MPVISQPAAGNTIRTYSFEDFGAVAGDQSQTPDVRKINLMAINAAIKWSSDNRQPVYGLGDRTYEVQSDAQSNNRAIFARDYASVICFDGCVISRSFDTNLGGLRNPENIDTNNTRTVVRIAHFTWTGGTLRTERDVSMSGSPYYAGNAIDLIGDDIVLKDMTVLGWGPGALAMGLRGSRIHVVNPHLTSPGSTDGGGIRVTGGDGFRCFGGYVEGSGDGALQFSNGQTKDLSVANTPYRASDNAITNGAYIGTKARCTDARLILVGSSSGAITNVRFEGIDGTVGGNGRAIAVQNLTRPADETEQSISDVFFDDVSITADGGASGVGVTIANQLATKSISDVRFDNLVIKQPGAEAFVVKASAGAMPVSGVSWHGGGVFPAADGFSAISLGSLANAAFEGLEIVGATGTAPTQPNPPTIAVGATGHCETVAFSDVALRGVRAGAVGIRFADATACGFVRGAISGDMTAATKAASFVAPAAGCFVTDANLAAIGAEPAKVDLSSPNGQRLVRNYGSQQQTYLLGAKTTAVLSGGATTVSSGYVGLGSATAADTTLTTINGGQEGDLLVLTSLLNQTITVSETGSGNVRLSVPSVTLNNPQDTLTLLRRATDWVEVAAQDNA